MNRHKPKRQIFEEYQQRADTQTTELFNFEKNKRLQRKHEQQQKQERLGVTKVNLRQLLGKYY